MAKNDEFTKLERTRAELASKCEELAQVEAALLPLDEARVQLQGWIQREGEAFDVPSAGYFAHSDFHGPVQLVHLADGHTNLALEQRGLTRSASDNLGALFCALVPDQVERIFVERLEREIAASALVLSNGERTARLTSLRGEIHALEISEEAIVRSIEDRGVEIARRTGVRPEIVLALDLEQVEEAA